MNGKKITFGVLAAIIAAKVAKGKFSGSKKEVLDLTGIPISMWNELVKDPFQNEYIMDLLTRNFFINSLNEFYSNKMVFLAENLGQLYNPDMCPIRFYLSEINQNGVHVVTSDQMNIQSWLWEKRDSVSSPESIQEYEPSFLFMIELEKPDTRMTIDTTQLIADTIGPQLYFDCYHNLISS